MSRRSITDLARNPDFVPGIYNYCDRWCERCAFTGRCLSRAMEEGSIADPGSRDPSNKSFWEGLEGIFRETIEMLEELAAEQGIVLESVPDVEQALREKKDVESHGCVQAAKGYARMVSEWIEERGCLFDDKGKELEAEQRMDLPGLRPAQEAATITDALEVIQWYHHQIAVKLMRAVRGRPVIPEEGDEHNSRDAAGSAKVALIGVDRSIAAWSVLRTLFAEEGDAMLDILIHLDRLRRRVEAEFPSARAFVRPGFDDPVPKRDEAVPGTEKGDD